MTKKEIIIRQIKSDRSVELRNEIKDDDNRTSKNAFIIFQIQRTLTLFAIIFIPWRDAISLENRLISLLIFLVGYLIYLFTIDPIIYYGIASVLLKERQE